MSLRAVFLIFALLVASASAEKFRVILEGRMGYPPARSAVSDEPYGSRQKIPEEIGGPNVRLSFTIDTAQATNHENPKLQSFELLDLKITFESGKVLRASSIGIRYERLEDGIFLTSLIKNTKNPSGFLYEEKDFSDIVIRMDGSFTQGKNPDPKDWLNLKRGNAWLMIKTFNPNAHLISFGKAPRILKLPETETEPPRTETALYEEQAPLPESKVEPADGKGYGGVIVMVIGLGLVILAMTAREP